MGQKHKQTDPLMLQRDKLHSDQGPKVGIQQHDLFKSLPLKMQWVSVPLTHYISWECAREEPARSQGGSSILNVISF